VPVDALHDVVEEVGVEVGPVGAGNVDYQLDHFLGDKTWHGSMMLEQKFVQLRPDFRLFVSGHADPPLADDLLEGGERVHGDVVVLASRQECQTLSPGKVLI